MLRSWAVGTVVVLLVAAGCAAPPKLVSSSTPTPTSPSPEPSPSPSPSAAPLTIPSAAFHAGEIGFAYAPMALHAAGGVPPYTWSISAGSLPGGLQMTPGGSVSGTPTAAGTYLFTASIADSIGTTASVNTSIAVTKHVAVTGTCTTAQPCFVEAGCLTACGVFGNESGGVSPFTYKVVGGAIPTGMGLSGFSLTKAFPSPAKDWIFTVIVTDAIGATAKTTAKFHVFPHIAFTAPLKVSCVGTWQRGCTVPLYYQLGTPNLSMPTAKMSPASLPSPAVATAVPQNGTLTFAVQAVPCNVSQPSTYTVAVTVVLVDKSFCSAGNYCASSAATVTVTLTQDC